MILSCMAESLELYDETRVRHKKLPPSNGAHGRSATLGLEELILWLGITALEINDVIVKIVAQVLVIVGNYVISKFFVFRKEKSE